MDFLLALSARAFDALQSRWESHATQRRIGTALVVAFLGTIALAELRRRALLPPALAALAPASHLAAVNVVFTLLLLLEVASLVLALPRSVADSVGKQFELLSLILLRKAFFEFAGFGEPITWEHAEAAVPPILADLAGALAVFAVTEVYYRIQRHQPITAGTEEQANFVRAKKAVALALLASFVVLAVDAARTMLAGDRPRFFETFYTILIFSDILIVLLSLRYSVDYAVVFRNSAFAAATVLIRLALTAPAYVNVLLGVGASVYALLLSLAYNAAVRRDDFDKRLAALGTRRAVTEGDPRAP
jgi:hypothetical protein